jgi:hypothetical protein
MPRRGLVAGLTLQSPQVRILCLPDQDAPMDIEQIRAWVEAAQRTHLTDAGAGSLQIYRSWPPPPRPDLKMFAFAIERGDMFDRYDVYRSGAWPEVKPDFGGQQFDAIVAANFIEHIDYQDDP